ncbi:MAG: hypothetical protein KAX49_18975 [Halanaerobiales bacterium]|nr:hypothetical protein [Halanaerobiales bacterium]
MLIENIIKKDYTKDEMLRIQFCWFALFELGLPVDEIRNKIKSNSYKDGRLITSKGCFEIPQFHHLFLNLSQSEYDGFYSLKKYIDKLGTYAKLDRKLVPKLIKKTRENYMIKCGNCHKSYENFSHNWVSVNNRIVCFKCAEELKKNLISIRPPSKV